MSTVRAAITVKNTDSLSALRIAKIYIKKYSLSMVHSGEV
jgi:hypothetical protein